MAVALPFRGCPLHFLRCLLRAGALLIRPLPTRFRSPSGTREEGARKPGRPVPAGGLDLAWLLGVPVDQPAAVGSKVHTAVQTAISHNHRVGRAMLVHVIINPRNGLPLVIGAVEPRLAPNLAVYVNGRIGLTGCGLPKPNDRSAFNPATLAKVAPLSAECHRPSSSPATQRSPSPPEGLKGRLLG